VRGGLARPWGIGRDAGRDAYAADHASRADDARTDAGRVRPRPAAETRREPVATKAATVPAPAAASLLVRTCWRDTMAPAAQIGVSVLRPARGAGVELAAVSDAGGFTRFSGLTPGPAQVLTDRGAHAEVALDAGRECELTLLLETGFELEGTVVDEQGGPVPDARIWLEPNPLPDLQALRANAQAVAVTDGQGAFRIRGLSDKQDVWARKPGHAPSARHYVLRGQRALEIVLPGAGAALQGQVLGRGQPVSGAELRLWPARREPPYTATERGAPYATATADREGRFRIDDLPAGATRVQVRAAGYAKHLASVVLPALGRADVTLELEPAATLHGSVTSALGGALAGAQVTVTRPDELQGASATVAGDGSYRIDDAPLGAARVTFARRGYATSCRSLVLAGEATRCDAVLQQEPAVRGRLQDEAGRPLAGWNVMGYVLGGRSREWERARTDASGRFRLPAHRGAGYGLRVTDPEAPFRWIRCEGLAPLVADDPQVTITIGTHQRPSAFVSGRIVDEKGNAVGGAGLRLADDLGVLLGPPERTAADGTFRIGPLAPSTYQIGTREFDTTEVPPVELARFEVHPGERKDLGTLRIARDSKLVYRFLDPEGHEIVGLHAFVARNDGEEIATLTRGGAGRGEQQLPPGAYWLEATSPERAWAARSPHPFTVRAGETTRLELRFVRAGSRTLRLCIPSEAGPVEDQRVTIRIDHPHGETFETRSWLAGGGADPLVTFGLGLGAHRIVLTLHNGLELAGRFTVAGDRGEDVVTPVALTRLR
jgi:protocatechuate 3,4-dioxygenase beta subunit